MSKRDEDRERRLAEALRTNLARRKAQARETASAEVETPSGENKQPR